MPERGTKTLTVPFVWATFGIFSARTKWFPVGHDWWPWTELCNITMTRRQSNSYWSGGISAQPAPKNSECKNPLEVFSPRFGINVASSSLIIFQRAKLSARSITHLYRGKWWTFWRKNSAGISQTEVLFLHENARAHREFATQKKLAYLAFEYLDHPPYSNVVYRKRGKN